MTDVFIVTLGDGSVHTMVQELDFFKFLLATKSLVESQRKALRTGDKKGIQACKERERALLDYVTQYEARRAQYVK